MSLQPQARAIFLQLAIPEESKNIEELLESARQQHDLLLEQSTFAVDGSAIKRYWSEEWAELNNTISTIEEIIRHFPWRVGLLTLREISNNKEQRTNHSK